jgi:hypothetical protein
LEGIERIDRDVSVMFSENVAEATSGPLGRRLHVVRAADMDGVAIELESSAAGAARSDPVRAGGPSPAA